jgi:delta8-fatty-acid desaturase
MHPQWVKDTKIAHYCIGKYEHTREDKDKVLGDGRTVADHRAITQDFLKEWEWVRSNGYCDPDTQSYIKDATRIVLLFMTCLVLVTWFPTNVMAVTVAALSLGIMWQQASFVAHDLGHAAVTQGRMFDWNIGIMMASLLGGLSISWWKRSHNQHHIITNHPEHDPDIQHLPFLAISDDFFNGIYSTFHSKVLPFDAASRFFVSMQDKLYYVVMSFGRFNLYVQSWLYATMIAPSGRQKVLEVTFMTLFWVWYGGLVSLLPSWGLRLWFIYISHMITGILHVQITLSHFGMPTDDYGHQEAFAARQMRTTMDVECPRWMDWFHGGLQFQVVHHLFPRVHRYKLRELRGRVLQFCKRWNLDYHIYGFVEGNGIVLAQLQHVAKQAKLIATAASMGHLQAQTLRQNNDKKGEGWMVVSDEKQLGELGPTL